MKGSALRKAGLFFSLWEGITFAVLCVPLGTAAGVDLANIGYADDARVVMLATGGPALAILLHALIRMFLRGRFGGDVARDLGPVGDREAALPLRFAILGDTGHRPTAAAKTADAVARGLGSAPLQGVWIVGDFLGRGRSLDKAEKLRVERPFRGVIRAGVPLLCALGNHDHGRPFTAKALRDPLFNMEGMRYYSRTFGDNLVTFFVLDSTMMPNDPAQAQWFLRAVHRSRSKWKVLLIHHPLRSSDAGHGPSPFRLSVLKRAIEGPGGVQLVVSGHNHLYERAIARRGVVHVVAGSASICTRRDPPPDTNRAFVNSKDLVHLTLEVAPGHMTLRAITPDGLEIDTYKFE